MGSLRQRRKRRQRRSRESAESAKPQDESRNPNVKSQTDREDPKRRSTVPTRKVEKDKEYAAGMNFLGTLTDAVYTILSQQKDDIDLKFGIDVKRRMLCEPAIAAPFQWLGLTAVEYPLRAEPVDETAPEAAEAAEFCNWITDNLERPIEEVIFDMSDYPAYGTRLAEINWHTVNYRPGGPLVRVPKSVKPKDQQVWNFEVDAYFNIKGIVVKNPELGGAQVSIDPEKFFWLTWKPKGGDPRGTSLLRPGFESFVAKRKSLPEWVKFLVRHGTPIIWGELPEELSNSRLLLDQQIQDEYDLDDDELDEQQMFAKVFVNTLASLASGASVAVPFGWKINKLEVDSGGEQFWSALDYWDRQMVMSILGATRSIMESRHGSRADSQSAERVVKVLVVAIRRSIERAIAWSLYYPAMVENFGEDYAKLWTPNARLGPKLELVPETSEDWPEDDDSTGADKRQRRD